MLNQRSEESEWAFTWKRHSIYIAIFESGSLYNLMQIQPIISSFQLVKTGLRIIYLSLNTQLTKQLVIEVWKFEKDVT